MAWDKQELLDGCKKASIEPGKQLLKANAAVILGWVAKGLAESQGDIGKLVAPLVAGGVTQLNDLIDKL
jgi:hypothetical protein